MTSKSRQVWGLILMAGLMVWPAKAQQKDPRVNQPVVPVSPGESSSQSQSEGEPVPSTTVQPDNRPLSGAESFSLGIFSGRSLLSGSLRFMQVADSNGQSSPGVTQWRTVSTVGGDLLLQRVGRNAQLNLDYVGGGTVYNNQSNLTGMVHGFNISSHFSFRRWALMLGDSVTYMPESSFGAGGVGGLGFGGLGAVGAGGSFIGGGMLPGLGGSFGGSLVPGTVPSQTILTGRADRVANTAVGQLQYSFSARDSWTVSGSYGILRFLDDGYIDSDNYQIRTGYNRVLSAKDSFALYYSLGMIRFSGASQSTDNHAIHLAYGRKITGRLAWQVAGGPQISLFENPVSGSDERVSWSMHTSLLYKFPVSMVGLRYSHGITGGSGVLLGAETDRVDFRWSRPFSRNWNAGFRLGYAHNRSLRQLTGGTSEQRFHGIDFGVNLGRAIGRHGRLLLLYGLQYQNSNTSVCTPGTTTCGTRILRHNFGLGFTWGFGPYNLD